MFHSIVYWVLYMSCFLTYTYLNGRRCIKIICRKVFSQVYLLVLGTLHKGGNKCLLCAIATICDFPIPTCIPMRKVASLKEKKFASLKYQNVFDITIAMKYIHVVCQVSCAKKEQKFSPPQMYSLQDSETSRQSSSVSWSSSS